ncbi:TetR family transcriptional regulator [Marinactinospora thermotolerans]|uniref:Transcriptional regulator, TetR family n=1 Tax=Marinactinospora thermotolerans DSM 45154 TaxID=1122192 RepID=A0A1T4SDN4_9ACTN|nr:TetR family transcriptional regulator [Marinactinospora thermotolerans]SKA26384.1 transcriptional regulator, TetR family [Marinactinospora thermotolerans DSM 45154]
MVVQAPAGRRARNQNQRRRRIVRSATALTLRGGVEAMQMRTVAERSGVALGTLYRYFPSKMDLVVAVVTEELQLLEKGIARRPPTAEDAAGRAVDVLMRATRGLMREPELADALVRSLIMAEVRTDVGPQITDLLWRVATRAGAGDGGQEPDRDSDGYVRVGALASVWVFELLEILKGHRDIDRVQRHLEVAAGPLLADL